MECKVCNRQFEARHFNEKCCSDECRKIARSIAVRKYKDTDKGKKSRSRWYDSPARVACEKRYTSKPKSRALSVKRVRNYENRNPEKKKALDREYGYRSRGYNAGTFDRVAVAEKFNKMGGACVMCGSVDRIEVDHIIPLSKGGTNHIDNLQPLCKRCNSAKGNRI